MPDDRFYLPFLPRETSVGRSAERGIVVSRLSAALCTFAFLGAGAVAQEGSVGIQATLKGTFEEAFVMGVALPDGGLSEAEWKLLTTQFSAVTPENGMKPAALQPEQGLFRWEAADALVEEAERRDLRVNGHVMIWHEQCPDWFFQQGDSQAPRDLVLKRLREHVAAVGGRYAGKVQSWDVVNEALADGEGFLRDSPWSRSLGEGYVIEAFLAARLADSTAELCYNDYNIESPPKRDKAIRLLRLLKDRGALPDAIGIQGHWLLGQVPFEDIETAILAFHAEGVKVMITELDIDVVPRDTQSADISVRSANVGNPFPGKLPPEIDERLARDYAQLFALFAKHHDKISRITLWGLHDGRSWLNHWPSKRTNHPLLWDRELHAKPALQAILQSGKAHDASSETTR